MHARLGVAKRVLNHSFFSANTLACADAFPKRLSLTFAPCPILKRISLELAEVTTVPAFRQIGVWHS